MTSNVLHDDIDRAVLQVQKFARELGEAKKNMPNLSTEYGKTMTTPEWREAYQAYVQWTRILNMLCWK